MRLLNAGQAIRLLSTHSRPPHQLLVTPLLPPPASDTLNHVSFSPPKLLSPFNLQIALQDQTTLATVVKRFSHDSCQRHKTPISWPLEKAQEDMHAYHRDTLVSPILQMLSQLRDYTIKDVLQCTLNIPHPGVSVIHITSVYATGPDVTADDSSAPTLIFLPTGALRNFSAFLMHSALPEQLLRAWQSKPAAKIVCTDLESVIILQPPSSEKQSNVIVYERHTVNGNLVALRILLAAYIYDGLPFNSYLAFSRTGPPIWDPPNPHGCPIDPATPLLPDEEVFATHRRHSDFDLYSLMQDRERGLQFFRWKEHVTANPRRPVSVGDTVPAITHGFLQRYTTLKPYFPIGTIPSDTLGHIHSVQRVNPLDEDARFRLVASERFTLEILEDLAQAPSTTFRCRIHSIDGKDMASSPDLCVKFFDDRLFPMDPDLDLTGPYTCFWWKRWMISEECVRNEDAAYKRLSMAQGSLVPFYYGAHLFTLSNGDQLFGLLMEYVPAPPLKHSAASLTESQRAEFVRSVRHAVRLLDRTDVCHHGLNASQLLLLKSPHTYCVVVDFSGASISVGLENHAEDDYGDALATLMDPKIGLGGQVVLQNFGEREEWDSVTSSFWHNGKLEVKRSKDPFSFVYESSRPPVCSYTPRGSLSLILRN